MKSPLTHFKNILICGMLFSTMGVGMASANEHRLTQVELDNSLYFMTPGGDPVQVRPGKYNVEPKESWLQLTPTDGKRVDAILLEANEEQHDQDFHNPSAFLKTAFEKHPDLQHLVLYMPGGMAYEAMGSQSGVWPRWGLSSITNAAKKVGGKIKGGAKAVGRAGKKVGKTVASGARRVGRGAVRGAKSVGRAGKKVGRTVVSGARRVGRGAAKGARTVGSGVKRGAKAVVAAGKAIRNQFCPPDPKPTKPFIKTNPKKHREAHSFNLELAYRWAPVHYQDTARNGKADYITNFDYDNDWDSLNNWDNLHRAPLRAYVYYSVTETKTHWHIIYSFFHPRDYASCIPSGKSNLVGEHENDMEGALTIVRKSKDKFGTLEGMVTVSHHDFYSYKPKGSPLKSGKESIDGTLYMVNHYGAAHPMTAQEANGHGLKAWPQVGISKTSLLIHAAKGRLVGKDIAKKPNFRGGDGIIYYPSNVQRQFADIPKNKNDRYVEYALIDFHGKNGVWNHRKDPKTVITEGKAPYNTKFRGNKSGRCGGGKADAKMCETDAANAPWGWDDIGDPVIGKGDGIKKGVIATDPAKLVSHYFKGLGQFSREYINNPYAAW